MRNRSISWIIMWGLLFVNAAGGLPAVAQTWTKLSPIGEGPGERQGGIWGYDEVTKRLITVRYTPEPWPGTFEVWALTNADGLGGQAEWVPLNTEQHSFGYYPMAFFHDPLANQALVLSALWQCPIGNYNVDVLTNANGMGGSSLWERRCLTNLRIVNEGVDDRELMGYPASVYDPISARLIVAGGGTWSDPWILTDHVWLLKNANGAGGPLTWERLYPAGTPPPMAGEGQYRFVEDHALFDPNTNRAIFLLRQESQGETILGVWVLTNANGLNGTPEWIELHPTGAPPLLQIPADATYDPDTNRLILLGGFQGLGHVSVLTHANGLGGQPEWILLSTTNGPEPPQRFGWPGFFGVVFDRASDRLITVGWDPEGGRDQVWVLDHANGITNEPPTANAGPDQSVIVGESAQFDGSASYDPDGVIASFHWAFSDGATAEGAIVNHVFTSAGQFVAALTVSDDWGASASDTATVTVQTSAQAIGSLSQLVQSYNLTQGILNSLDAKLDNALDALNAANAGQRQDAAEKLQAFMNAVEAQRGKQITSAQADVLIAYATRILGVI